MDTNSLFSNPAARAFIISVLGGAAILSGYFCIYLTKNKSDSVICASLGFAAGIMLAVSVAEMMPEAYGYFLSYYTNIGCVLISLAFFVLGAAVCRVSEKLLFSSPSLGTKSELYRLGVSSAFAVILHNFPEGIVTYIAAYDNMKTGIVVGSAIALHNITEGMIVALPLYFATGSKTKAFSFTLICSMAAPLGAVFCALYLKRFISPYLLGSVFSFVSGVMCSLAFGELLPRSYEYGRESLSLCASLAGILFVIATEGLM